MSEILLSGKSRRGIWEDLDEGMRNKKDKKT